MSIRGTILLFVGALLTLGAAGYPANASSGESPGQKSSPELGVLAGRVDRGPRAPVARPGEPGAAPVAGVKILVYGAESPKLSSAVTNDRGQYRLRLLPGTYRVAIAPLPPGQFTKDLPAEVTIFSGQETRLDVHIDTGMR